MAFLDMSVRAPHILLQVCDILDPSEVAILKRAHPRFSSIIGGKVDSLNNLLAYAAYHGHDDLVSYALDMGATDTFAAWAAATIGKGTASRFSDSHPDIFKGIDISTPLPISDSYYSLPASTEHLHIMGAIEKAELSIAVYQKVRLFDSEQRFLTLFRTLLARLSHDFKDYERFAKEIVRRIARLPDTFNLRGEMHAFPIWMKSIDVFESLGTDRRSPVVSVISGIYDIESLAHDHMPRTCGLIYSGRKELLPPDFHLSSIHARRTFARYAVMGGQIDLLETILSMDSDIDGGAFYSSIIHLALLFSRRDIAFRYGHLTPHGTALYMLDTVHRLTPDSSLRLWVDYALDIDGTLPSVILAWVPHNRVSIIKYLIERVKVVKADGTHVMGDPACAHIVEYERLFNTYYDAFMWGEHEYVNCLIDIDAVIFSWFDLRPMMPLAIISFRRQLLAVWKVCIRPHRRYYIRLAVGVSLVIGGRALAILYGAMHMPGDLYWHRRHYMGRARDMLYNTIHIPRDLYHLWKHLHRGG